MSGQDSARKSGKTSPAPDVSVVVATYNRAESLVRLLGQLAKQTYPAAKFEVIAVDDGSRDPAGPHVDKVRASLPYHVHVERQSNAGAAAARHKGATLARGDIILIVDDDMQVPPEFVAAHMREHAKHPNAVVLGRVGRDPAMPLTLFERFHVRVLERLADDARAGRSNLNGMSVYTGNVSMRRSAYERVGGFDFSLGHSEDAELGVRLEKDGAKIVLSLDGYSIHSSDHTSLDGWMRRAFKYGVFDSRIAKKHPDMASADPWRYFGIVSRMTRPFMLSAFVVPKATELLARGAMQVALASDKVGLERIALAGSTFVFGLEYARGMREEQGGVVGAIDGWVTYAQKTGPTKSAPTGPARVAVAAHHMAEGLREDAAMSARYAAKYGAGEDSGVASVARDVVHKVGLQIMAAYRVMRFFREANVPLVPKVMSRAIRHAYGSDIHWDADLAPGVVVVHGMGMAINGAARVERGAILFQNVTLGAAAHPETKVFGGPHIGENVHVGPGAVISGPFEIGARSKIMGGIVVRGSVPSDSIVAAPEPTVVARAVRPAPASPASPAPPTPAAAHASPRTPQTNGSRS